MQGSPSSPAGPRLWRPAAQRNVRNSWSIVNAQRASWAAASAQGLSAATALVNSHLSYRYMPSMDLGVLKEIDGIRTKAQAKLLFQQEDHFDKLFESYKNLVQSLLQMMKAKDSMKTYVKNSADGPLSEFSNKQMLDGDTGDGGGIAVFSALSLHSFEVLLDELLVMFVSELKIKWLLVSEFHAIVYSKTKKKENSGLKNQSPEALFGGIHTDVVREAILGIEEQRQAAFDEFLQDRPGGSIRREVLQVYLTAWLAEVNINKHRIQEILAIVSGEMQVNLSLK